MLGTNGGHRSKKTPRCSNRGWYRGQGLVWAGIIFSRRTILHQLCCFFVFVFFVFVEWTELTKPVIDIFSINVSSFFYKWKKSSSNGEYSRLRGTRRWVRFFFGRYHSKTYVLIQESSSHSAGAVRYRAPFIIYRVINTASPLRHIRGNCTESTGDAPESLCRTNQQQTRGWRWSWWRWWWWLIESKELWASEFSEIFNESASVCRAVDIQRSHLRLKMNTYCI